MRLERAGCSGGRSAGTGQHCLAICFYIVCDEFSRALYSHIVFVGGEGRRIAIIGDSRIANSKKCSACIIHMQVSRGVMVHVTRRIETRE